MESGTAEPDHTLAQFFGVIVGLALAALLAKLSLTALSPETGSYGGIGLMFAALGFGVPLFILNLCITFYLLYKRAFGASVAAIMWLPMLASLAIIPVSEYFRIKESAAHGSTHPSVREIHVNLTGRDVQFDPLIGPQQTMGAEDSANFLEVRREPVSNRGDKMAAYRGVLLAPDFKSMPVIYGTEDAGKMVSVPVTLAPTPARWEPLLPQLGTSLSRLLLHYYYHYPDRVEVASAIDWDDGYTPEHDNGNPASGIVLHNLSSETVVRLEVDGQTVPFYRGLTPLGQDRCTVEHSTALLGPDSTLTVRWQTAQAAPKWQQVTATLPAFRGPIPSDSRVTSTSVHLFLHQGGRLTVQRAQTFGAPSRMDRVRVSEALPPFATALACGDAAEQYPPAMERWAG
jgi:hypothetical protein